MALEIFFTIFVHVYRQCIFKSFKNKNFRIMSESLHHKNLTYRRMVCIVPALPMRKEASERSEMVSQVLYGEEITIIEKTEKWLKINTLFDNYEGWVDAKGIGEYTTPNNYNKLIVSTLFENHTDFDKTLVLPAGSELWTENDNLNRLEPTAENILETAMMFLGIPYLWGGRSSFGIDCSGFVQTVFKINNIQVPRDAYQQVSHGHPVEFFDMIKPADLVFFGEVTGNITHVGIALENNKIIHASGMVRVDMINHQGIYNQEIKKYTHQLRVIKRLLP
jgi:cell wall-associated NlpC family hydrolase